ncbi:ComF family protein [Dactylosporangium sp. CS-033363]|uniref:ComF family protein n=1 Tax=Dactylosporangium sp. CS-033363 TaxID=3239935 RepID=UPI003D8B279B
MTAVRGFVDALLDLVLPATCAGCDEPAARALCDPCLAALHRVPPRATRPDPAPDGMPPTYALAAYAGVLQRAVVQFKEKNRHELAGALGGLLGRVVDRAVAGSGAPVVLVPVPSTAAAVRRRHGDHMLRLARAAARGRPGAAIARPLRALPRRDDSAELTAAQRAAAARDAFAVRTGDAAALRARVERDGAVVVVLDDIVTTGVTLTAAARRLEEAGVPVHRAAVLAATQRRRERPPAHPEAATQRRRERSPAHPEAATQRCRERPPAHPEAATQRRRERPPAQLAGGPAAVADRWRRDRASRVAD